MKELLERAADAAFRLENKSQQQQCFHCSIASMSNDSLVHKILKKYKD